MRTSLFQRLRREPLVYFLTIGALIYLLYGFLSQPVSGESDKRRITITAGQIDWLETTWEKRWRRPPTAQELQGLIDTYVKESILYREAVAMGLDQDDTIIRRRLAQKLEFLVQDLAAVTQPSESELKAYFEDHADRYRTPDLITFTHLFLDPDKRGDKTIADANELKDKLRELEQPTQGIDDFGDTFMLQRYYPERSEAEIAKLFGGEFAGAVFDLPKGQWQGPVLSGYGTHLVHVQGRKNSPKPEFATVEARVRQDWLDDKRKKLNQEFYDKLLARYDVMIEDKEQDQGSSTTKEQAP